MSENKPDIDSSGNVFDNIKPFLKFLQKRLWMLIVVMLCGLAIGTIYYFKQKPNYIAESTFILEEKSSGTGGLAGLASQFGLSLGGISGGGIFAGDNILDILKSKTVVTKVLLSTFDSAAGKRKTLADHYIDVKGIRPSLENDPKFRSLNFPASEDKLTPIQDSLLNDIYNLLVLKHISTEKLSRQSTIIRVQVTSIDGVFARLMTERLVQEASELYMTIRIGSAQENIKKLQRRSDSLLALVNNRTFRAAAAQPIDLNPGLKTAVVPTEIANRDKTVLTTLYAEVTKNLEVSKVMLSQQTPVIQLLDKPSYLLHDNKISLIVILLISIFLAMAIYFVGAFVMYLIYQELGKLK